MTERRGILFDKDGTLIDFTATWLPLYRQAARYIETRYDQPGLADKLLNAGGFDTKNQCWVADSTLASGSNLDIMNFWQSETKQNFDQTTKKHLSEIFTDKTIAPVPIIKNLEEAIKNLKSLNYHLGVATMDDAASARSTLLRLNILDTMDFVCGADSGYGVKPEAGMIQAFCEQCQLHPADVIMVGDSPRDLQMVTKMGAGTAIGVLSGASNRADLTPYADVILDDIGGLQNVLQDLRHKIQ